MVLNIALFETMFEEAKEVINLCGYPCIVTDSSMYLVKPVIDNARFSTLEPSGSFETISDEELLTKLKYIAQNAYLLPKVITVKVWSNFGLITKDDKDFIKTRGIPFRNRIHYYKSKIQELNLS